MCAYFSEHTDAPNIILDGKTDSIVLVGRKTFDLDAVIATKIDAGEVQKMKKIIHKRKLKVRSSVGACCTAPVETQGVGRVLECLGAHMSGG